MTSSEEIERRRALFQELDDIWGIEGLETSPEFKELRERFISGEISLEEFKDEILPKPGFNV